MAGQLLLCSRKRGTPGAYQEAREGNAIRSLGSAVRVACLLIGAVIGAGFASGREIAAFFGPLQEQAALSLATATAGLAVGARAIALASARGKAHDYGAVMRQTAGPGAGAVLDGLITAFLYLTAAVTLSGGAALLNQNYGLPPGPALALVAAVAVLLTVRGAPALLRAGSIVVPVLLAALLLAVVGGLLSPEARGPSAAPTAPLPREVLPSIPEGLSVPLPPHGPAAAVVAGLLYAGFNLILSAGVIAAGTTHEQPGPAVAGSAAAGAGLGLLAAIIFAAITRAGEEVMAAPIPVAMLAARLGPLGLHMYAVALFLAVLTTVAAACTSLAERSSVGLLRGRYSAAPLFIAAAALPAQLGFARLVQLIYPPMGLLGLIWLWRMLCLPFWQERNPRPPTLQM